MGRLLAVKEVKDLELTFSVNNQRSGQIEEGTIFRSERSSPEKPPGRIVERRGT